jgi:hypothetical protein
MAHTLSRALRNEAPESAVKACAIGWIRCGNSSATMIDTAQPSPAAGRGWHVLQTITTLVVTFVHQK